MMNSIRAFFLGLLMFSVAINPVLAVDTASLLPNAVQQFFDNNGKPLTKGTVTTYDAGTSTLRTTWKDSAESLPNTNPIVLDAGGKAIIYGSGNYRQVVKDRNGNLVWDAVTAPGGGGSSPTDVGDGNLVGTILPWSGLAAPNQYVFGYGQEIARATYPEFYTATTQQLNVICTSASNTLTGLTDTSQIKIGSAIELALCVAAGTTVSSKTTSTVTLSNPSSVSINSVATFFPWGNGNGSTTFNVPDLRGYIPIGRDNMGGTSANRITTTNCGSGITVDALGANCNANPGGGHTLTIAQLPVVTPAGSIAISGGVFGATSTGLTSFTGAGSQTPTVTSTIVATFTGTPFGSGAAFSVTPPSVTINYIVKVTPDTSTSIATGVYSIGGMSGVITCGVGILCTGNDISFNSSSFAAGSTPQIQYNGGIGLAASPNFTFISPDNLTLGAAGVSAKFDIFGSTSGRIRQTVPAVAGTTAVVWGNSSGTPAVTATSPLAINSTTGDITCTTCVTPSSVNVVTNSNLSQVGAATFKGNPTASTANVQDFTIQGLTARGAPDASNDKIPLYDNAAGTIKYVTPAQVAAAATAGVSTLNGLTGGLTVTASGTNTISASNVTVNINNWGDPGSITNCSLTGTVAANALTIALKGKNGSDPSATNPCYVSFRNSTIATGDYTVVTVSAATSFATGTSLSSFGSSNSTPFRLWITAWNNAGTVVLGVSNQSNSTNVFPLNEGNVQSSTACSACTTATSAGVFYTTSAQTSKAIRILGYMDWASGLATAGTWASGPTTIQLMGPGIKRPGEIVQLVTGTTATQVSTTSTSYVNTNLTASITPTNTINPIHIATSGVVFLGNATNFTFVNISRAGTQIGPITTFAIGTSVDAPVSTLSFDNPATTSSTAYTLQIKTSNAATAIAYPGNGTGSSARIIIQEIQG